MSLIRKKTISNGADFSQTVYSALFQESDPLPHYYENAFIYRVAPGVGDVVKLTIAGIGIVILLLIIMHL